MAWNLVAADVARLSTREREIVNSLANGATAKEIAIELSISFHTVRSHIRNVYAKLGICNRVELMRWFSSGGAAPASTPTDSILPIQV